jgi:hypothetical protein
LNNLYPIIVPMREGRWEMGDRSKENPLLGGVPGGRGG